MGHCDIFILCFLFVHREFHVFFHPVFLTEKIIVEGAISGVCNWIFGIKTDCSGCEHKFRCLYKYDDEKNPNQNKIMKGNEW